MKSRFALVAALTLLVLGGLGTAQANPQLEATLTGSEEVNGGDPDGSGTAVINLSFGNNRICFSLTVTGIVPATAAHIHRGAAGANGSVVVTLAPPPSGGSSLACVIADPELMKEIWQTPENFYVNVHNADYPGGALRGQLHKK